MTSPAAPKAIRRRQLLEQTAAAQQRGDMAAASRLAEQALAEGAEAPALFNLVAMARYQEGRVDEAVSLLKRARALAPGDPHVLNALGLSLRAQGRGDEALKAFDAAIRAVPRYAPAHYNKGSLLEDAQDLSAAAACYRAAVQLQPDYADALAALAWLAAQNGETAEARAFAQRAGALEPASPMWRMALAFAELQEGELAAAEARLAGLERDPGLGPTNRAIVLGLIGDVRDRQGRTAEAFAAYQACNAAMRTLHAPTYEAPVAVPMRQRVRRLTDALQALPEGAWQSAPLARPRAADPAAHVFLLGFPRSGTTLLEQVLAAHPDVVSLEERDCLATAIRDYLWAEGGLARLAQIGAGEAAGRREAYWKAVRSFGVEPRGCVFIDKMPLASIDLPIIAKLFPAARILFARRDPRDVVLSCFRRRFGMNPSMYELLTLEGAAEFYAGVMTLAQACFQRMPLSPHIVRYEDLVERFEAEAGAACRFLGLDWNDAMLDFAAKARARGVDTPSASQVARGLNREGLGTWRRYRAELAPVLPVLEPWVERYGYPTD